MKPFLGKYQNRLDAKGRVSIPAAFRKELGGGPLMVRPSYQYACLEARTEGEFETLEQPLRALPELSIEQLDLATALFCDAHRLEIDKDGRVMLPDELIAHAHLGEAAMFMGIGRLILIWEPVAGEAFRQASRQRTLEREAARQAA